jgi:hypothetical protein
MARPMTSGALTGIYAILAAFYEFRYLPQAKGAAQFQLAGPTIWQNYANFAD